MKIVIVGCGLAGNEVASGLCENKELSITMVSQEGHPEYDPCSLPYYVGETISREAVFRKEFSFYRKAGIKLLLNSRATGVDSRNKILHLEQAADLPYDKLVLAHGGSLFVPPLPGIDKEGVFGCKSLPEADRLALHRGERAVIIGSGAIGVEVAEALRKRGYEVTIVEILPWILPTLFDEPAARILEAALEENGIKISTSRRVIAVAGGERVTAVVLDRGEIPCDTVVLATGVVPGKPLAESAGLKVARGILVDDKLNSSDADIFACGDCVETFDAATLEPALYQLKHNALEQARIVAKNILGENVSYRGAYAFARAHFFKTHAVTFGKTLRGMPDASPGLQVLKKCRGKDYLQIILKDGFLLGGQGIGSFADEAGPLISALWQRSRLDLNGPDMGLNAAYRDSSPLIYDTLRRLL